jgi:hypothetical protein
MLPLLLVFCKFFVAITVVIGFLADVHRSTTGPRLGRVF